MTRSGRASSHYLGERGERYFDEKAALMTFSANFYRGDIQQHISPTDTVVDFGCARGELLALLDAGRKLGIEVNEQARAEAHERGIETVSSPDELESEIADVVVSSHTLEHTLQPYRELVSLRRVLKPGGRIVMWLPLDDWRAQRQLVDDPDHHLYAWTPLLLRNLFAEAGFEVRECRIVTYAWPPRHYAELYRRLPRFAFDILARAIAIGLRRRQIKLTAVRPPHPPAELESSATGA